MSTGNRIKRLRKTEGINQAEFAGPLGIKASYVSMLERNKKNPSDQLLLSICRVYGVSMEWLRDGKGKIYDKRGLSLKGSVLVEEIYSRLCAHEIPVPISLAARVMGIDPKNPKKNSKTNPEDLWHLIDRVIQVLEEGDDNKIDLLKKQLDFLRPTRRK